MFCQASKIYEMILERYFEVEERKQKERRTLSDGTKRSRRTENLNKILSQDVWTQPTHFSLLLFFQIASSIVHSSLTHFVILTLDDSPHPSLFIRNDDLSFLILSFFFFTNFVKNVPLLLVQKMFVFYCGSQRVVGKIWRWIYIFILSRNLLFVHLHPSTHLGFVVRIIKPGMEKISTNESRESTSQETPLSLNLLDWCSS